MHSILCIIAFLQKADESLLVHNQVACNDAMHQIRMMYGPFDQDEIQFYKHRLSDGAKCTVNSFQRDLVFNLFFKHFGDLVKFPHVGIHGITSYLIAGNSCNMQDNQQPSC